MRPWVKWVLFGNSYTPFFLILLFRDLKASPGWLAQWPPFNTPLLSWTLLAIVLVSNAILATVLVRSERTAGAQVGTIDSISSKTNDSLQYIVTYIIPFLSFRPSEDLVPLVILLAVVGVLYVNSNLLYVNPMLSFFGYGVYDVAMTTRCGKEPPRIVVTRKHHGVGDQIRIDLLTGGRSATGKTSVPGPEAIYREVFS